MRIVSDRQKTLSFTSVRASARQRWEVISDVLDANPEIATLVWDDLTTGKDGKRKKKTGARGMSADHSNSCQSPILAELLIVRPRRRCTQIHCRNPSSRSIVVVAVAFETMCNSQSA
jgi:hypothetical protein